MESRQRRLIASASRHRISCAPAATASARWTARCRSAGSVISWGTDTSDDSRRSYCGHRVQFFLGVGHRSNITIRPNPAYRQRRLPSRFPVPVGCLAASMASCEVAPLCNSSSYINALFSMKTCSTSAWPLVPGLRFAAVLYHCHSPLRHRRSAVAASHHLVSTGRGRHAALGAATVEAQRQARCAAAQESLAVWVSQHKQIACPFANRNTATIFSAPMNRPMPWIAALWRPPLAPR